jgi:hypothetical protein
MSAVPLAVGRATRRIRASIYAIAILTVGPPIENGIIGLLQLLVR